MTRFLRDANVANVLIALMDRDHTSHERATAWFEQSGGYFATCPITQGALIRFLLRAKEGTTVIEAKGFLSRLVSHEGHEFWPDSVSFLDLPEAGVFGYRQVTDAYLVALARRHKGKLASLDRALAAIHAPTVVLVA